MRWLPVLLAAPLLAQQQPTFYSAWQDGLNAENLGHWAGAAAAFRRALELRPAPSPRIVIYGNNLLFRYYPRTHLARCLVELGDLDGAEAELQKAGHEPAGAREALARRIQGLRLKNNLRPVPVPPEREAVSSPPQPSPPPAAVPRTAEPPRSPDQGTPQSDTRVLRVEPAPPKGREPANPLQAPRELLPAASTTPPAERPANALPPAPPAAEIPRPLPWVPLGLGAGLALIAAWAWSQRSFRKVRFDRRGIGRSPAFSPGALPQTVGPYRIERLLGRGGFSDTFLAHHGDTGQEVALKVPHLHRADDAEFRARFYQEAQLGARLLHPNLVRILDPGHETGRPYLAMEYLPGQTLDERLKTEGQLPLAEGVAIALGVAEAMTHAHGHGVVHRDLKPGNIMLTTQGPKVMDLGIARIMDAATVTTTYAFLGTPLYAAPEAQLKTHVGPAADRYSLGVILFHMLAGAPPFLGETPFEILNHHRSALPPELLLLRPEVPPALSRLVNRLLDKEPDQRPDDSEILRVLADVAASLSAGPTAKPGD